MILNCLISFLSGACLLAWAVGTLYRRDRACLARALDLALESRREAFEAWREGNPDKTLMLDLRVLREEFTSDSGADRGDR